MVLGGKMVWACPSLSLGSGYSGVPSAFGRPLRAPSIPHAGHGKLIKVSIKWFCKELVRMLEKGGATFVRQGRIDHAICDNVPVSLEGFKGIANICPGFVDIENQTREHRRGYRKRAQGSFRNR